MSTHDYSAAAIDAGVSVARRARFARRVASMNLLMLGLGAAVIGVSIVTVGAQPADWIQVLAVPGVFLALWGIVGVRAASIGVRKRGVGYSAMALIAVMLLVFGLPVLASNVGALSLLGVGFLVIGWRERCQPVWLPGLAAVVVGLVTAGDPIRRAIGVEETSTSHVTSGIATLIFAVLALTAAAWCWIAENRGLSSE